MGLSRRRSGDRFSASIWPGFVDAMTALLLVLMFVLSIFMIVQFMLRETISGQETELDALSAEVVQLSNALGLERGRATDLGGQVGTLTAALAEARETTAQQSDRIEALAAERDKRAGELEIASARIDQVKAEAAELAKARDALAAERAELAQDREALKAALAGAREEIDAQVETARLAAARRTALEALVADLRQRADETATALENQKQTAAGLQQQLSEEEAGRLAEAAAVAALRDKLASADTERTAMTLALEEQRRKAEETLTLLAAAEAARAQAETAQQAAEQAKVAQMTAAEERAALLAAAKAQLSQVEGQSEAQQRRVALLNAQVAELRKQLSSIQSLLDASESREGDAQGRIEDLGERLNVALAQVASKERARAALEEAERKRLEQDKTRLEAEARDLKNYRSEFFGRLRDILGGREGVRIEGDRFVFSSEVLFESASARLSPEGKDQIARVADILTEIAGEIPPEIDWVIRVDGHTDNAPLSGQGSYADNWELSQARALSVVRYMTQDLGFPPNRLSANGFGEYQPLDPGDTPEARARNRRIELKLTER
ncbi:peptidoglycan -binding protein [Tropicimonas sp. IMCC34043]|uniref:peptidoglycan -binding protein n=1 Tax=Tropicimonas sp. IMCC34043 TaxID=2248760 RepID=UPI000E2388C5|nr:peptidoglycan -binding protein [Tropicimonas sp. IMCC34043]